MCVNFNARQLSEKYNRIAPWYDWIEGILDVFGLRRLRRRLLRQAAGKVLEVAVGTGKNLAYYPPECRIIAIDVSIEMMKAARKKASAPASRVSFVVADAEALPLADKSFETVVSSLSTCTFPNPIAALGEMARVCQTNGKVLLLEHGRSNRERVARFQDRHADRFAKPLACHWNREPMEMARRAGLQVTTARRFFLGIFQQIEASPG